MALLEVNQLSVSFRTFDEEIKAVRSIQFSVDAGQTLGIVGESGSGKSVTGLSLMGLVPSPPGKVEAGTAIFKGHDLLAMDGRQMQQVRGCQVAMIFQDPMAALNPYLTIGEQIIEPLLYHGAGSQGTPVSRKTAKQKAISLLKEVEMANAEQRFSAYPHEFSGGMQQRVMIAMALIAEPRLLIADEPTTALDVTIQAQILKLIKKMQQRRNLAVIFISHDLSVVAHMADHILVMYEGQVVESGSPDQIFHHTRHAYTRQLISSIPRGSKSEIKDKAPEPLLRVQNLKTVFKSKRNTGPKWVRAADNVSFKLYPNEILGLVGESGSGKTTVGRSILRLVRSQKGVVEFEGQDIMGLGKSKFRPIRKQMQMIFQNPYGSLNPRMSIFTTLAEPLLFHRLATRQNVAQKVLALMDDVGLARSALRKYPHEFSGGQRQRIAIGRAIATKPKLVIADEPVSALDVTIQAQILALLKELVAKHNLSLVLISHDLGVVRSVCDRLLVMQEGRIVEAGRVDQIFNHPEQPYTQQLLAAALTQY